MNRKTDLRQFFNFVMSLSRDISVPVLRELAALKTGQKSNNAGSENSILKKKLERIYLRMCRVQEELGRLDLKKAASGVSAEDYIFSTIDFSRYRKIEAGYFETLFIAGPDDFDDVFLIKILGLKRKEIKSLIKGCYRKAEDFYKILNENHIILSVMRTLETSLENTPFFTAEEIDNEMQKIIKSCGDIKDPDRLFPLLVAGLDGAIFTFSDGTEIKLLINGQGDLSGKFMPAGKPWTKVLIPYKRGR